MVSQNYGMPVTVTDLLSSGLLNIGITIQLDGRLLCRVHDIGHGLLLAHDTMMIAMVGAEED